MSRNFIEAYFCFEIDDKKILLYAEQKSGLFYKKNSEKISTKIAKATFDYNGQKENATFCQKNFLADFYHFKICLTYTTETFIQVIFHLKYDLDQYYS